MAQIARSVIDVILGEAVGDSRSRTVSRQERFDDMLAIASAIQNRAAATGLPAKDIVSVKQEFNAYGSKLPAGVETYRELAAKAWAEVQAKGPVHTGMFYATPKAVDGLPKGLTPVAETVGHQFFSDPQGRSFNTAVGYQKPDLTAVTAGIPTANNFAPAMGTAGQFNFGGYGGLVPPTPVGLGQFELPSLAPTPESRPAGPGMAALAPNGLRYDMAEAYRSEKPSSGIGEKVAGVASGIMPGVTTSLYSGQEPAGKAPYGTPDRHPNGFAGDFAFYDDQGKQITDPVAMHDIAMEMAAKYDANIGYDDPGYMGAGRMHIDTMPLDQFPGGAQWGDMAKSWAGNLAFARETGIGPTPYQGAPTPTSRDIGLSMPAGGPSFESLGRGGMPSAPSGLMAGPSWESSGRGGMPSLAPDALMAGPSWESTGRGGMPSVPDAGGLFQPIGSLSMPTEAPGMTFGPDRGMPGGPMTPPSTPVSMAPDRAMPGGDMSMANLSSGPSLPDLAPTPYGAFSVPDTAPTPFSAPSSVIAGADRAMPSGPVAPSFSPPTPTSAPRDSFAPTPSLAPTPSSSAIVGADRAMPGGTIASPVEQFANLPAVGPVPSFADRPGMGLLAPPVGPVPTLAPPVTSIESAKINPMKGQESGRHNKASFGDIAKGAVKGGIVAGIPGAVAGSVVGGLRGSRVENPGPGKTGPLGLGLLGTNRGGLLGLGLFGGGFGLFDGLFGGQGGGPTGALGFTGFGDRTGLYSPTDSRNLDPAYR